jgi:DNA-binding response OmpR family regulator
MKNNFKYNFSQFTVLIVEDEDLTLKYLSRSLEDYFGCVISAKDGIEAYAKFETKKIDIIITDFFMPNKTGFEFIKQIRKNGYNTPVIYMSSYPDSDILLDVIKQKISGFLVKPIDIKELLELIENSMIISSMDFNSYGNCQEYKLSGGTIVNLKYKTVENNNEQIILTKKEFELLEIFIHNEKYILTKEQIEDLLWLGTDISHGSVKSLINKIRLKVGNEAIMTIKNIGYKIMIEK